MHARQAGTPTPSLLSNRQEIHFDVVHVDGDLRMHVIVRDTLQSIKITFPPCPLLLS